MPEPRCPSQREKNIKRAEQNSGRRVGYTQKLKSQRGDG